MYLIIYRFEDAVRTRVLASTAEAEAWITDEMQGSYEFLDAVPPDLETWPPRSAIVFKGEVVVPKPVTTVLKYKLCA